MHSIIKLAPAFKDYLWGGTQLRTLYNKTCNMERIAESWELSNHPAGVSQVISGAYQGVSFSEYIEKIGKKGLGTRCDIFENFPVLIKFIDAKQSLSIQVHPSDDYALRVEKEYGKTEMWYILDCQEGASLYYGVNQEVTAEAFREHLENGTVLEVLNEVKVHKGDTFFIEAGTIHAIGAGIVICEIQQNSNTTYRVYDFDRRDDQGNLRELHIDKALAVSDFSPTKGKEIVDNHISTPEYTKTLLGQCKYFTTKKYNVLTEAAIALTEKSFLSIIVIEGSGTIQKGDQVLSFTKGDSLFIPAQEALITLKGDCEFITTEV